MPPNSQPEDNDNQYALPNKKDRVIQPLPEQQHQDENLAANVIRQKIAQLYKDEPSAQEEVNEAKAPGNHSKHQLFILNLSKSGKPLAEIQNEWHNYYSSLPDHEKHEVWREFYAQYSHSQSEPVSPTTSHQQAANLSEARPSTTSGETSPVDRDVRTVADIKNSLLGKINKRAARKPKRRFGSIWFGLSVGTAMVIITSLGFFNERFIAPFITPSKTISSSSIIIGSSTQVGPEPKLIIPKINLEVPVVYDESSIEEKAFQRALESGVAHYATTSNPGELGNSVIFGHSSNNILNRGKYKFAFVLLNRLEAGDTFMAHYQGTRYVYKVVETKIVKPDQVSVLGPTSRPATMTLITCDPPGTAINRLVVIGEQISPSPEGNIASNVNSQTNLPEPEILPSNAPSLWSRFTSWLSS